MPQLPDGCSETSLYPDDFIHTVDTLPVRLIRPADADHPSWVAYERPLHYLGTLHSQHDYDGRWHIQGTRERHAALDDAVRVLRRPRSWRQERERVRRWANRLLADPGLVVLDIQTTGLNEAWAVQIGATDRHGAVLIEEVLNPCAGIEASASALHGITAERVSDAPTFSGLLPRITEVLSGQRCIAYNVTFDRGVLERELHRLSGRQSTTWLDICRWEDAMRPYAAWKGLYSVHRCAYRYQPLGSSYNAVQNCRLLLHTLRQIGRTPQPRGCPCCPPA
ncbi:3'-5' exonuclease [Streptomyces aurantiacus]|uniref:Putative exonuclease CP81 n=1 Tax=Streptomyces aurantiacus JA 4570 TaxID=1286094 RepID=S3ZBD7_9ACTN|nr:3'-5' exonuclease [Streptomyces aurantiacus]EPH41026.1 putative exonuclease CP81 [Streptomyces aurantiacus JA 4570]